MEKDTNLRAKYNGEIDRYENADKAKNIASMALDNYPVVDADLFYSRYLSITSPPEGINLETYQKLYEKKIEVEKEKKIKAEKEKKPSESQVVDAFCTTLNKISEDVARAILGKL